MYFSYKINYNGKKIQSRVGRCEDKKGGGFLGAVNRIDDKNKKKTIEKSDNDNIECEKKRNENKTYDINSRFEKVRKKRRKKSSGKRGEREREKNRQEIVRTLGKKD